MIPQLLLIALATGFSTVVAADDVSMPPKKPKAQTTQPPELHASGEYGDAKFDPKEAKPVSTLATEGDAVIQATVVQVCPKKGCWMSVRGATPGEQVRVTFKDYGFFVPTALVGREVALRGRYVKHIESIEEQKHLMEDAKRPRSEIDAVTQPRETIRFIATGVKDLSVKSK